MNDSMIAQDVPGLMLSGPFAGSGPPTRAAGSALRAPATKCRHVSRKLAWVSVQKHGASGSSQNWYQTLVSPCVTLKCVTVARIAASQSAHLAGSGATVW